MIDEGDNNGGKRDCIVKCEGCGRVFPGKIDAGGAIRALGTPDGRCCERYGLREVEDETPDGYTGG